MQAFFQRETEAFRVKHRGDTLPSNMTEGTAETQILFISSVNHLNPSLFPSPN